MSDELNLTDREIYLIEKIGVLKAISDINDQLLLCLSIRLGGSVKLTKEEIAYTHKTYELEHNIRADCRSVDVILSARLK